MAERSRGKRVLLAGLRPEQFEDAALVDDATRARGVVFRADVDVTEWLGSQKFAYVPFEAPDDVVARLRELARELDSESLRTQLIVSLDPASGIRARESADLWLDTTRLHLFDPETGESLLTEAAQAHVSG